MIRGANVFGAGNNRIWLDGNVVSPRDYGCVRGAMCPDIVLAGYVLGAHDGGVL